jgi:hypothetical protein
MASASRGILAAARRRRSKQWWHWQQFLESRQAAIGMGLAVAVTVDRALAGIVVERTNLELLVGRTSGRVSLFVKPINGIPHFDAVRRAMKRFGSFGHRLSS